MSQLLDIDDKLRGLREMPVEVTAQGLLDVEQRGRSLRRRHRRARLTMALAASVIVGGIMLSRQARPTTEPVRVGPAATTAESRPQPLPSTPTSTATPPVDQPVPSNQPTPEELVATEAAIIKLNAQIAAGWIPFSASPAVPGIDAPPELWMAVNVDDMMETLRTLGEGTELVGAAPLFDQPEGSLVGYHIPSFGYIPVEMVPEFDTAEKRIAIFGCDPLATDSESRLTCKLDHVVNGVMPLLPSGQNLHPTNTP